MEMDLKITFIFLCTCKVCVGILPQKYFSGKDCSEVGLLTVMFQHLQERVKKLEASSSNENGKGKKRSL